MDFLGDYSFPENLDDKSQEEKYDSSTTATK